MVYISSYRSSSFMGNGTTSAGLDGIQMSEGNFTTFRVLKHTLTFVLRAMLNTCVQATLLIVNSDESSGVTAALTIALS